jgi:hypothetical protein
VIRARGACRAPHAQGSEIEAETVGAPPRVLAIRFLQRSVRFWSLDDHSATAAAEDVATPWNAQLAVFDQRQQGLNDRVGIPIGSSSAVRSLILLPLRECV